MKAKRLGLRIGATLLFLCLTLIALFSFTSCSAGSDEILSKDELRANINTEKTYDYVWEYLDEWNYPTFDSSRLKEVEYTFKTKYYEALPSTATLASSTANAFLDGYYEGIDLYSSDAVTDALIRCYVKSVGDKYATYRTQGEYSDYKSETSGTIVGIGVNVSSTRDGDAIAVNYPLTGSPAEAAGILAGDLILAVDGATVAEHGYETVVNRISGEIGTYVTLTVKRGDESFDVRVLRAMVNLRSVDYFITDGIGYISISSFKSNTYPQFKEAIDYMKANGARGIIYDLRGNLGGYLNTVTDMIEYLAPRGTTVVSYSNNYQSPTVDDTDECYTPPAIILTDYNTASAAELFTAAVCDLADMGYGRAIRVGKTTRGKGIMQSTFTLSDGSALTMTVAYYNPPSGNNFHGVGLAPHVEVENSATRDLQLERAYAEINNLINN